MKYSTLILKKIYKTALKYRYLKLSYLELVLLMWNEIAELNHPPSASLYC